MANNKKIATLTHISQIQEEHLKHLELENDSQIQITLNSLRDNQEMLALYVIHKARSTGPKS
jgi:hypothetical protein